MADSRNRVVMCGCHEAGYKLISDLIQDGVQFSHFVALSPEQGQAHGISGYRDFRPLAERHGIPLYVPESYSLTSEKDLQFFLEQRFDLLIQGGWQRLFPAAVLRSLRLGAVGGHGSADFLPKGRGRSPLNWSLIEGRRRFIMQMFLIQEGVDDGPVFDFEDFDILPFDDIETLYLKNSIVMRRMLLRSLPRLLAGELKAHPQAGVPTYYAKRTDADGLVDWEAMDVWQVHDFVRALARPYPGATAVMEGRRWKIWRAQVFDTRMTYPGAAYGEVVDRFERGLVVNCRGGLLLVTERQECATER